MYRRFLASALLLALVLTGTTPVRAATVPDELLYEARLLDNSGAAVTTAKVFRFSLWKSGDWSSGDATSGAINTSALNYGGWFEIQTVTPSSSGIIQVKLGTSTALPTIDLQSHKYLQVEVKSVGDPDTSYVLLDPTGDAGADTNDRKFIGSVAYAKNADAVAGRTPGTGSGDLLLLGPDGRVSAARMGSGTTATNFALNAENASADPVLRFGNDLELALLTYVRSAHRFEFNRDVLVRGNLTATGSISASGSILTEGGLTINQGGVADEAVLTFGSTLGVKSLSYVTGEQRFKFNDSLSISGSLTVSGTINGVDIRAAGFFPLRVTEGSGLSVNVASGSYRLGNTIVNYDGVTGAAVPASATSYVFFGSGGLTIRTMAFPTDEAFIPLAVVTTNGSTVTDIDERRVLQSDTREQDATITLSPEFDGAVYQADASNNVGTLTTDQDGTSKKNFYKWTSTRTTLQDYDIFVRVPVPEDFVRFRADTQNAITIDYRSTSADSASNAVDVTVYDTNGSPVSLSGSLTGLKGTSWTSASAEFQGSPVWTQGQEMLLRFHLSAKDGEQMQLGTVRLHYTSLRGH